MKRIGTIVTAVALVTFVGTQSSTMIASTTPVAVAKNGLPEDHPKPEKPQRPEKPGRLGGQIAKHGQPEDNPKPEKPQRPEKPGRLA